MSTPATPASSGTDRVGDVDVIARADRARTHDRRVLRATKRVVKWVVVLMLVAVPVACLAMPMCTLRFPCRSKQSEAKGNLKVLYVAEESYRAEYGHYTDDPRAMGFEPRGVRLRYEYFVKANEDAFEGYAVAVREEVNGDVWRITDANDLANLVSACSR